MFSHLCLAWGAIWWELPNDLPLVATCARIGGAWERLCCESRLAGTRLGTLGGHHDVS